MAVDNLDPWDHPEIRLANASEYVIGYVVSLALLGFSLFLVTTHAGSALTLLLVISALGLVTVTTQLVLLFHLDFSETQRWNSLTLMLNVPLLILSIGLTSWMFRALYTHVMAPGLMPH